MYAKVGSRGTQVVTETSLELDRDEEHLRCSQCKQDKEIKYIVCSVDTKENPSVRLVFYWESIAFWHC